MTQEIQKNKPIFGWLLILLVAGLAAIFVSPLWTIVLIALIFLALFLVRRLDLGLLILVFFFPYLGLVVDFSNYINAYWLIQLREVDAPLVDLFGCLLLLAWLGWVLIEIIEARGWKKIQTGFKSFPYLLSFSPFLLSAFISLRQAPSEFFLTGLKYIFRPILFFYLIFFVPTISIIKKYGWPLLIRVFRVMYATGLITALMGLVSFFVMPMVDFPRATPLCLFGICPLGNNHNLLAETLVATGPIGFLLWWLTKNRSQNPALAEEVKDRFWLNRPRWLLLGSIFQVLICLLTFARTAWIALFVQAVIVLIYFRQEIFKNYKRALYQWIPFAILFVLLLGAYMTWTFSSYFVMGSNLSRFEMARIAWYGFSHSPWLGQGAGMFLTNLKETFAFIRSFGDPLDAHGVIWKLIYEQGILGLVTFFFFIGILIRRALLTLRFSQGERKIIALVALVVMVGSVVYQLFNTDYYNSKLWVPLGVAMGAVALCNQTANSKRE